MEDTRATSLGRAVVFAAWLAIFVIFGFRSIFAILARPIAVSLNLTQTEVTTAFSIMMLCYAIFAFISGMTLDKWGNRPSFIVAAIFGALSYALSSQVSSALQLYVTFGVMGGICTGMLWVSATGSIRKWYAGKTYGAKFGLAFMGGPLAQLVLGFVVRTMLGNGAVKHRALYDAAVQAGTAAMEYAEWTKLNPDFTWKTCLLMLAGVLFVLLAIAVFFCRRSPDFYGCKPFGAAPPAAPPAGAAPVKTRGWSLGEAFSTAAAWMAVLAFLVCMLSEFLIWAKAVDIWAEIMALPAVAKDLVVGSEQYIAELNRIAGTPEVRTAATNMYLVVGAVGIFSIPLMGIVADKIVAASANELIGRKRVLMLAAFLGMLAGIVMLVQYKTQIVSLGYISAVLFAFFWGMTPGNTVGYLGAVYGPATLGRIWGLCTLFVMGPGPFLGPILAAFFKDMSGGYFYGIIVAVIGFVLGAVLSSLLPGKPYPPKLAE